MRDADLQTLIRLAAEADGLAPAGARRLADVSSNTRRVRALGLVGLAAAAALALMLTPAPRHTGRDRIPASAVHIRHLPGRTGADQRRVDQFRSSSSEPCAVLAIFHSWSRECECLAWKLHEWEQGRMVDSLEVGESADIALNVTGAPPVQQLLFLAVAPRRDQLPGNAETTRLLACLNEAPPPARGEDWAAYASTVQTCLPSGVTVVPQPFVVRP